MSPEDLHDFIHDLVQRKDGGQIQTGRLLDDYLRSLWRLVRREQSTQPSFELFAKLFQQAYETEPVEFDPRWYSLRASAYTECFPTEFAKVENTILFQIADLRTLTPAHFESARLYFGANSSAQTAWANLEIADYLGAATTPLVPVLSESPKCSWKLFEDMLYCGQIIE